MAQTRAWFLALLLAVCMVGCSGSEYRFGNTKPLAHTLSSISVTPATQSLTATGQSAQFISTGNYTVDPIAQDLTAQAQWSSSAPSVATVSSTGITTAVGAGTTTISATFNGVTGSATVTVNISGPPPTRTLTSIAVIPSTQTAMTIGEPGQFIAVGSYTSAPLTQDLTTQVIWSSSDSSVASVTSPGLAVANGTGTATITANSSGVVGTATLTVTAAAQPPRTLTSITVIPSAQTTVSINQPAQFIAIGNYIGNPATQNLTTQVTWSSSAPTVASINPATGVAQTLSAGSTTIAATSSGGIVGTAALTVSSNSVANQLTAINIIPSAQTAMMIGDQGQFIAIGSYTGSPSTQVITVGTKWDSSNQQVATVSTTGVATAVGLGTTTITASGDTNGNLGVVGTATLTVTVAAAHELTSINVIPGDQTVLTIGEPTQFIAIGSFTGIPATQDITNQVAWSSSDVQIAAINATGLTTGINAGTTTIVAKGIANSRAVITGTSTLTVQSSGTGPNLPILAVYEVGQGSGNVQSSNPPPNIDCNSGSSGPNCTQQYSLGTVVTLIAFPKLGAGVFGGFSANCQYVPDLNPSCPKDVQTPPLSCTCQVTMGNNQSVGAIFNLF